MPDGAIAGTSRPKRLRVRALSNAPAIRCNCVAPGYVATRLTAGLLQVPEFKEHVESRIPMGRFVEVAEIAALVCWLASEDCSFSTGAVFDISGGRATY